MPPWPSVSKSWDMFEKLNLVAIDGPSGVGKSTVSKKVAAILGYTYLDTGAMYRGVGFYLQTEQVDLENALDIQDALSRLDLQLTPAQQELDDVGVIVNGKNVSDAIRSSEMAMVASAVSAIPQVRVVLTELQKSYGRNGRIVAEGRDMGTVVFPGAEHKFFLDAEPEERARRRVQQLQQRGMEAQYPEILEMILKRDKNDSERKIAPLKQAADAILVDTTDITVDDVVALIVAKIAKSKETQRP